MIVCRCPKPPLGTESASSARHHPPGDAPCRLLSQLGHFDSDEHSEEVKKRRRRRRRSYAQPQQTGQAAQEEMRHKWPQGTRQQQRRRQRCRARFNSFCPRFRTSRFNSPPLHSSTSGRLGRYISNTEEKLGNIHIIVLQIGGQN